jgi:hypothetical protein
MNLESGARHRRRKHSRKKKPHVLIPHVEYQSGLIEDPTRPVWLENRERPRRRVTQVGMERATGAGYTQT